MPRTTTDAPPDGWFDDLQATMARSRTRPGVIAAELAARAAHHMTNGDHIIFEFKDGRKVAGIIKSQHNDVPADVKAGQSNMRYHLDTGQDVHLEDVKAILT